MSKSIFISTVHEDSHYITNIKRWAENDLLGDVVITHETEDKRIEGHEAIRNYLRKKIEGAAAVLVLVGKDTHNHDWIRVEVELANSFQKPILCMRIPGTTGGIPQILKKYEETKFDPSVIKNALF